MKHMLVYLLALLLVSGCNSTPEKTQGELKNMSFMDTEEFDKNLSDSMSFNTDPITVTMIGAVSINQIPARLGKWFSAVRARDGRVDIVSTSISKLPSIFFKVFKRLIMAKKEN